MLIVHVEVHVKPEFIDAFNVATADNATKSRTEAGIARFDVIQDIDDPSRFLLVEVYRTPTGPDHHKATEHYTKWRDIVEPMMAEPRKSKKFVNISPDDADW